MKQNLRTIRDAVDGDRITNDIRTISSYHRIQASTGYREAARKLAATLQSEGIDARILSYPFDEKHWYLASKSFMEWDIKDAWLELVTEGPKVLADFRTEATAIVQKSHPCDHRREPLDIVMLEAGATEASCEDLDFSGKLLFLRDDFNRYMDWAFAKKGAIGFVTDYLREVPGVRTRADLYDARNYTSFWWQNIEKEPAIFGFVLTPRQGDELAALCRKMTPSSPQARCEVDTSLYPGEIEVVECYLKGEIDEDILIVAHLCHPRPSANDNASGAACALEAARVIHKLLDEGRLPALRRGIRILWVPEFAGTYAWLSDVKNPSAKIIAGINLDMVGGRQLEGYGPLTLTSQPQAAPSIVTAMAEICLEQVKKNAHGLDGEGDVPMFNAFIAPFSAGSDHQVLSDPTIDIPTPMLGQWPDKHYHTSADTVERVDPFILHKSASIAAGFSYALANLNEDDAFLLLSKAYERFIRELVSVISEERESVGLSDKLRHIAKVHQAGIRDVKRFFKQMPDVKTLDQKIESFSTLIDRQLEQFMAMLYEGDQLEGAMEEDCDPALEYAYRPVRLYRSPIMRLIEYALEDEEKMGAYRTYMKAHHERVPNARTYELLIQYYIDGERTLGDITRLLKLESGCDDPAFVHAYVQLLMCFRIVRLSD